ncbi:hypothetical protein HZA55_01755 [Candidatus Poribacteria bacterium]|nr:hypothetical protein [Candidatus Poribacteria bacterium]
MVVFDASTLILLAKVDLLRQVTDEIKAIISDEVKDEVVRKKTFDSHLIEKLILDEKINILSCSNKDELVYFQKEYRLDKGEASVLLLAYSKKLLLATDDGMAIKTCKILNVRFFTAIHFLIFLVDKNIITKEIALLKLGDLKKYGRYQVDIINKAENIIQGG